MAFSLHNSRMPQGDLPLCLRLSQQHAAMTNPSCPSWSLSVIHPIHCVQVNSFAAQFESVGNSSSFAAVNSFYNSLTTRHSFATGGSNDHEYWGPPLTIADAIMEVRSPHCAPSAFKEFCLEALGQTSALPCHDARDAA